MGLEGFWILHRIRDDGIDVTPEMIRANGNIDDEDDDNDSASD